MSRVAILINIVQIFNPPLTEGSIWSLKKFGQGASEEKSFKGVNRQKDGRTDGQQMRSDHKSSSWAFGSGELKRQKDLLEINMRLEWLLF